MEYVVSEGCFQKEKKKWRGGGGGGGEEMDLQRVNGYIDY